MFTTTKFLSLLFVAIIALVSCDNTAEVTPEEPTEKVMIDITKQTLLLSGDFSGSSAHPSTTGKAKIYQDANNSRTLVIEDLKVDNGPELRIYMAEDAAVTNFVEITNSVKNGTNSHAIPLTVNLEKQKIVSVWCKQFAVSFGNSPLVKP
jgi:hypothetical protein